ncbi:MAG: hypothetical protein J6U54_18380 [Clostridiales bacterium]|nr:hypothetical protein [Clostridiales bacterium]
MEFGIRIYSLAGFVNLLAKLKAAGMLKSVPDRFELDEGVFPLDIPLDGDKILDIIKKPVVKAKYGKDIDHVLTEQVLKLLG